MGTSCTPGWRVGQQKRPIGERAANRRGIETPFPFEIFRAADAPLLDDTGFTIWRHSHSLDPTGCLLVWAKENKG